MEIALNLKLQRLCCAAQFNGFITFSLCAHTKFITTTSFIFFRSPLNILFVFVGRASEDKSETEEERRRK